MVQAINGEFTLRIKKSDGKYMVEADGPQGLHVGALALPNIEQLRQTHGMTLETLKRDEPFQSEAVQQLGRALYQAIFPAQLPKSFGQAIGGVGQNDLRLCLLFETPDLMDLPWEIMHDEQKWLALDVHVPLVRRLRRESTRTLDPKQLDGPMQILLVAATPPGFSSNPINEAYSALHDRLQGATEQKKVLLTSLAGSKASLAELSKELEKTQYDVVIFVCHGETDKIYLEDMEDKQPVHANDLANIFNKIEPQPPLIFLAACETGATGGLEQGFAQQLWTQTNVAALVAMQYALNGYQAQQLAAEFFAALVALTPVEIALAKARTGLLNGSEVQRDIFAPILYIQDGIDPLFQLSAQVQDKRANLGDEHEMEDSTNQPVTWFGDISPEVTAIAGSAAELACGQEVLLDSNEILNDKDTSPATFYRGQQSMAGEVHGLFSGHFLSALRDKAADLDNDGLVSVEEALITTWNNLRKGKFHQSPVIVGKHRDLALFYPDPETKPPENKPQLVTKSTRGFQPYVPQTLGALSAVLIGINNYPHPIASLKGAVNDANLFSYLLTKPGSLNATKVNLVMLVDEKATRGNIEDALDKLVTQAGPASTILFYFSGMATHRRVEHDSVLRLAKHLVPFDINPEHNGQVNSARLISVPELAKKLAQSKAQYKLLIIDA